MAKNPPWWPKTAEPLQALINWLNNEPRPGRELDVAVFEVFGAEVTREHGRLRYAIRNMPWATYDSKNWQSMPAITGDIACALRFHEDILPSDRLTLTIGADVALALTRPMERSPAPPPMGRRPVTETSPIRMGASGPANTRRLIARQVVMATCDGVLRRLS